MPSLDQRAARNLDRFQDHKDVVCMWDRCSRDAHPLLAAPICMDHAKQLTVQVMLLASKKPKPELRQAAPEAPKKPAAKPGIVYFVLFGDRVKIGYTTSFAKRMKAIPHDKVLALIPGSRVTERSHHTKFAKLRMNGEWFFAGPALLEYIETLPKHEQIAA